MLKGDTNIHWGKARKFCCGIGVGGASVCIQVFYIYIYIYSLCVGVFSGGPSGKEPACRCRRRGFNPWVGKIP